MPRVCSFRSVWTETKSDSGSSVSRSTCCALELLLGLLVADRRRDRGPACPSRRGSAGPWRSRCGPCRRCRACGRPGPGRDGRAAPRSSTGPTACTDAPSTTRRAAVISRREGHVGGGVGQDAGRVADGDAAGRGGGDVDVVEADREVADHLQLWAGVRAGRRRSCRSAATPGRRSAAAFAWITPYGGGNGSPQTSASQCSFTFFNPASGIKRVTKTLGLLTDFLHDWLRGRPKGILRSEP